MFPVTLNLSQRLALVVGGGNVGRRKARNLLECAARVRLVSLDVQPDDFRFPTLEWRTEPFRPEHLADAGLVFAAATPDVNRLVAGEARRLKIWVNLADDPGGSDFFVPAVVRRGGLVVAVGTGGAAPGLARAICDHLQPQFDEAFGQWVALLEELRPQVLARFSDTEQRRELFSRLYRWDWLERLRRDGVDSVRNAMLVECGKSGL